MMGFSLKKKIFFFFSDLFMDFSDADPAFRARFLEPKFEPELFVQSIGKPQKKFENIIFVFLIIFSLKIDW
jgi:hypothetical protein